MEYRQSQFWQVHVFSQSVQLINTIIYTNVDFYAISIIYLFDSNL